MKPAPVQNPTSLASLSRAKRRTSCASINMFSFNICYSKHPDFIGGASKYILTIIAAYFFFPVFLHSQIEVRYDTIPPGPFRDLSPSQKAKRQWLVGGANVVGYGTSIIIFNNQWYKNYPKTSFHTFNDSKEWLQVDKVGHAWAAYNSGRASQSMWTWTGMGHTKATLIGGISSTVYLTVIEILDAHSSKWGWSWSDIGANFFGSGLFISQALAWGDQRIQFKFSFHRKNYGEQMLDKRADDLFGKALTERMLKDYNGQTYWLSINPGSFLPQSNLPLWLNIAIGYGAEGMFGGFENKWTDGDPGFPIDRTDIKRYRQWYLAPDINFSKIKTNKKGVRTLLFFLDAFKFPTPSLELSNGKFKVNAIHF